MSTGEMFGGQVQNFGDSQNVRGNQRSSREASPESPALNLKCYAGSSSATGNTNNNSPQTVAATPSPTERPQTPVEPENLSINSDKETVQPTTSHSSSAMDNSGRDTPMVAPAAVGQTSMREYLPHPEHGIPPASLIGAPSSMYQPFPAVRSSSFYPIEHYFPHPATNPTVSEARHAPPPAPHARTPPR